MQRSVDDPLASNDANVTGTLNVLVAARDCGVRKVVYASSSSVYGDTPTLPKKEDMKPNPKSPYAITKMAGEYYLLPGLLGCVRAQDRLRYFNVFGPRQDPKSEYAAVIPRFVTRILQGKPPVIYGDGQQTRDFTFVKDVVKANILAGKGDAEGVFNIACGRRISLNELAGLIMEIVGRKVEPEYEKPRAGDIRDSLADISAAGEALGYHPDYDMNSGLKEPIKWFQKI